MFSQVSIHWGWGIGTSHASGNKQYIPLFPLLHIRSGRLPHPLLLTSGGHHLKPVQTCLPYPPHPLHSPPPTSTETRMTRKRAVRILLECCFVSGRHTKAFNSLGSYLTGSTRLCEIFFRFEEFNSKQIWDKLEALSRKQCVYLMIVLRLFIKNLIYVIVQPFL